MSLKEYSERMNWENKSLFGKKNENTPASGVVSLTKEEELKREESKKKTELHKEWLIAKEKAIKEGKPVPPRPGTPKYLEIKEAEITEKEQETVKEKKPELVSHRPQIGFNVLGSIQLIEQKRRGPRLERKSILDTEEARFALREKLSDVYVHRPNPENFIGAMEGTLYAKEYTEEKITADIKYLETILANIDDKNARYGEWLEDKIEAGFEAGEMLQAMIIDRLNNGWLPEMEAIMTAVVDDVRVGIDSAMKYKKDTYFGTSLDMTVSEDDTVIKNKIDKYWTQYVRKGKIPVVKYFEDPENPTIRGRRVMPKFIIGGSHDDLEVIAKAYLDDDLTSIANHPLKYGIVSQIDAQLYKIIDFYKENLDDTKNGEKYREALAEYSHFADIFEEIKKEIKYTEAMETEEVKEYLGKNKIFQISKNTSANTLGFFKKAA